MAIIEPKNGTGGEHTARGAVATPESPLRVILVGRTGLDAGLRADPGIELVRVRSRLEAIGELADRPTATRGPSGASVVVVGPDGPERVNGSTDAGTPGEFIEALRRVDPRVRLVAAGPEAARSIGACDAVVRSDAAAETIRRVVRGIEGVSRAAAEVATPEVVPATADEPRRNDPAGRARDAHVESAVTEVVADPGAGTERAVVAALLRGNDPLPAVLTVLRRRLGGRAAEFVAAATDRDAEAPGDAPPDAAPVIWNGRVLGLLRCPGVTREALEPHADALAAWIALRDQHAQLRAAAFTDPLTGASNRRYFDRFLATAIEEARRLRRSVTVLVFDVDDFKTFNDRHGHAAGDDILRETVRLIRSVIRPSDKVCRIGGDEFAVIFHEPDGPRTPTSKPPADIFGIAQRFQREVCSARFPKLGESAPGALTISGGLATYPWDGRTPEELLHRADELALESKRQGKNAIRFGPDSERVCPEIPPR
ncbi:MAG: diguanylate cyclase domain-containing protein [Phycisphaerales bacterium]